LTGVTALTSCDC